MKNIKIFSKNKLVLKVWLLLITMAFCIGLSSCSKDDVTVDSTNVLLGKWSFQDSDSNGIYTANWTFNNDGTMMVNDKNDLMNGQLTAYSYNSATKKLSLGGGLIIYQLVWESNTKFSIITDVGFPSTVFTKI
jgi:hypothetical protein